MLFVWHVATRCNIMAAILEKDKVTSSRLNVRLSPEIKARITRAAHILGQDLTEFAARTLDAKAIEVIERNEIFELTEREREFFFDYLDGKIPAKEHSAKALRAAKEYKKGRKLGDAYEFSA